MPPRARRSARPYDVVLYGASGFVGRQTVEYFARHAGDRSWALAGRSASRLEVIRREAGAGAASAGIIVADAADRAALDALAAQARVVLSTAGPFASLGSELVAACVAQRAHYVDITGETPWVRDLIDRHHEQAQREGTRIIPCCGFDSVPSDLGAWLVAREVLRRTGKPCVEVKASHTMRGGLNGGTLASALNLLDAGETGRLADPFLLNPPGTAPDDASRHADPKGTHHDADFDAWLAPFVMGPINTRIVRRSAGLARQGRASPYATDFAYQEFLRVGTGVPAAAAGAAISLAMATSQSALRWPLARRLARTFAPAPGAGPSLATMDGGWFRCELVGHGADASSVRGRISGQGDPGNRATTRFVCEAALALACDDAGLPGPAGAGGVLTPATGLGLALARRLAAAGMVLEPLPEAA